MQSRFVALAVLALLAPVAWAQVGQANGMAADGAMERARRAAAGPLKAIQQAAKIRRRSEPDPAPASVVAGAVASAVQVAVLPLVAARATDHAIEPPALDGLLELGARPSSLAGTTVVTEVAPIAAETRAPATATATATASALPTTDLPTQALPELRPLPPQVLQTVEPGIPPALLAQEPRGAEVEAELSLLADGSVASATLLSPVPPAWQRYIVAALELWRFEPMSIPRAHRVRLVLNAPTQP